MSVNVSCIRTVVPTSDDVILGRGCLHAHHPGNVRFYSIIDTYLPLYEAAQSRTEKTKIVQRIYETISSVGRFVKDDMASGTCVVITPTVAKKKISHAIRFRSQGKKSQSSTLSPKIDKSRSAVSLGSLPPPTGSFKKNSSSERLGKHPQQDTLLTACQPVQVRRHQHRSRSSSVDSISIFQDEELESVLLLPAEDLAMARLKYEDFILGESLEELSSSLTLPPL